MNAIRRLGKPESAPTTEEEIFTVQGLDRDEFTTYGLAVLAAAHEVVRRQASVVIYRNGEPYDVRRF